MLESKVISFWSKLFEYREFSILWKLSPPLNFDKKADIPFVLLQSDYLPVDSGILSPPLKTFLCFYWLISDDLYFPSGSFSPFEKLLLVPFCDLFLFELILSLL